MPLPQVKSHSRSSTKIYVIVGISVSFFVCLIGFSFFKSNVIKQFNQAQQSLKLNNVFYDINSQPFHVIQGGEDRNYVPLRQISKNIQMSVTGIEDTRFFHHMGFDVVRIVGAIIHNLTSDYVWGASTLTQQLVKLTLLSSEQKLSRKIKELFMSIALETEFSKAQILEFYLNKVYFGHGSYGVENASKNYFNKSAKDLNLAEGAFLAGLIKKPEGYSPYSNLKQARKRQVLVLKSLLSLKWISFSKFKESVNQQITINRKKSSKLKQAPYFTSHIIAKLRRKYGVDRMLGGGLRIYTTLDRRLQVKMEKTIKRYAKKRNRSYDEMAGVSIDPTTGFVKALVGGVSFEKSEFNRVTQARRQPGSSFKPILYSAALTNGINTFDVFEDEPTEYSREVDGELEIYEPTNYSKEYQGSITVAQALRTSNNVVSVKILKKLGYSKFKRMAKNFGLKINSRKGLCLALGCAEQSLLSMTNAYSVFANEGYRNKPVFILKITDNKNRILEEYVPEEEIQVLSENVTYQMRDLLQDVIKFGTGRNAKINQPAGGKTGTSDNYRDAWFIGFTSGLVSGFWIGNDNNTPMNREVGGRTPARMWKNYMKSLPQDQIQKEFPVIEEFEEYQLCAHSGKIPLSWCPTVRSFPLLKNDEPTEYCDIHSTNATSYYICNISGKLANRYCPIEHVEKKTFSREEEPNETCDIHLSEVSNQHHPPGELGQEEDQTTTIDIDQ